MPDEIISLRDFMDLRFLNIEREIANFQSAIERIALEMITRQQFERVTGEVDILRGALGVLEKRELRHDADMRIIKWLGSTVMIVVLALVVAYFRSVLGV